MRHMVLESRAPQNKSVRAHDQKMPALAIRTGDVPAVGVQIGCLNSAVLPINLAPETLHFGCELRVEPN